MSGRANLRRTTDHWATVRSGYCPIGLLSCRITVSWFTISRATVCRGCVLGTIKREERKISIGKFMNRVSGALGLQIHPS